MSLGKLTRRVLRAKGFRFSNKENRKGERSASVKYKGVWLIDNFTRRLARAFVRLATGISPEEQEAEVVAMKKKLEAEYGEARR